MRDFRFLGTVFLSMLVFEGAAYAQRPSFDCSKASKPDEIAICSDERLAELDRLTTKAFEDAKVAIGVDKAREIGRNLLRGRASCGGAKVCIFDRQVEAMIAYDEAGITVASPPDIKNYRKLIQGSANNPVPTPTSTVSSEGAASRELFKYLTAKQRAMVFDPKWFAEAPNRTVTVTSNCTNCGAFGTVPIRETFVTIAPSVHRILVKTGNKDEEEDGYKIMHGLIGLPAQGADVRELTVRSDVVPIGQSREFGFKVVSVGNRGVQSITTICSEGKDVAASSVATGAAGIARVYSCTESRQYGVGETKDNILNRQKKYAYFADYGFFVNTYWDVPATSSVKRITALH